MAENTVIVRLYNLSGEEGKGVLRFDRDIETACSTDLMEQNGKTLPFSGKSLPVTLAPWKIMTFRIALK